MFRLLILCRKITCYLPTMVDARPSLWRSIFVSRSTKRCEFVRRRNLKPPFPDWDQELPVLDHAFLLDHRLGRAYVVQNSIGIQTWSTSHKHHTTSVRTRRSGVDRLTCITTASQKQSNGHSRTPHRIAVPFLMSRKVPQVSHPLKIFLMHSL